jgi:hypothetical protein
MATACSQFVVQSRFSCLHRCRGLDISERSLGGTSGYSFSSVLPGTLQQVKGSRRHLAVQARSGKRRGGGVGFGPPPKVKKPKKIREDDPFRLPSSDTKKEDVEEEDYASDGADTVPEVVTNRMLKRMGLTVGVPLIFGLGFFPMFWYLKVMKHLEIPNWIPYFVSIFTFGAAGEYTAYSPSLCNLCSNIY